MTTIAQIENQTTTLFRGPTLEALLPQIREQLGPDAVVVRRRDGVTGGVAGFFRRRCVEIEARPGRAGIDTYDDPGEAAALALRSALDTEGDEPADAAIGEGLRAPAIRALIGSAAPFAEHLAAAAESAGDDDDIGDDQPAEPPAEVPSAGARRPGAADTLEKALVEGGVSARLAAEVVAETVSHLLPFGTPRGLRRLVRRALARRVAVQPLRAADGGVVAFAGAGGAGKTLMVARLAAAYAARGELQVTVVALRPDDGGARLSALLAPAGVAVQVAETITEARAHVTVAGPHAMILIDTPAVCPTDATAARDLADDLAALGAEVQLCVPGTLGASAARALLDGLAPLTPAALAVTHLDETPFAGAVVELAMAGGPPLSFLARGTALRGGLDVADPVDAAALLLH